MTYNDTPPTKASLLKWWRVFSSKPSGPAPSVNPRPPPNPYQPPGRGLAKGTSGEGRVFGVPIEQSLRYAGVAISTMGPDGKPFVYGYVPTCVGKCGMMLKETATQTEGIFRVSGSNKRINQLQAEFDEPPRYGKDLDWTGYSVHDAASVLRRYLNQMPEPVIPANLYLDFTAVLQNSKSEAESISAYQHLITLLPPPSRFLLLYLLDLLSVFVRSSSANLMSASNLAVVFQPGLVSTRREGTGDAALLGFPGFVGGKVPVGGSAAAAAGARAVEGAGEHGKGKEVLEFLIEQQSHFMMGLAPPSPSATKAMRMREAEDSGYGPSGSSPSSAGGGGGVTPMGGGTTELNRRGSEKSVERRRLRKSHDGGNGKVKRSRTLPGGRHGETTDSSPIPRSVDTFSSSSPTPVSISSSRPRKSRRETPASPSPVHASPQFHSRQQPPNPNDSPTMTTTTHVLMSGGESDVEHHASGSGGVRRTKSSSKGRRGGS